MSGMVEFRNVIWFRCVVMESIVDKLFVSCPLKTSVVSSSLKIPEVLAINMNIYCYFRKTRQIFGREWSLWIPIAVLWIWQIVTNVSFDYLRLCTEFPSFFVHFVYESQLWRPTFIFVVIRVCFCYHMQLIVVWLKGLLLSINNNV